MLHHHYHNAGTLSTFRAIWHCNYTQKSQRPFTWRIFNHKVHSFRFSSRGERESGYYRSQTFTALPEPSTALFTLSHEYIFSALHCLFKQRDTQSWTACQWCQYYLTVGIGFAVRYWTLTFFCADFKKLLAETMRRGGAPALVHFTIGCGLTELSFIIIL